MKSGKSFINKASAFAEADNARMVKCNFTVVVDDNIIEVDHRTPTQPNTWLVIEELAATNIRDLLFKNAFNDNILLRTALCCLNAADAYHRRGISFLTNTLIYMHTNLINSNWQIEFMHLCRLLLC